MHSEEEEKKVHLYYTNIWREKEHACIEVIHLRKQYIYCEYVLKDSSKKSIWIIYQL